MKYYLGNKMTGIPFFNAPWFDKTAENLRRWRKPEGDEFFNPVDGNRERGMDPMLYPDGIRQGGTPYRPDAMLRIELGADWAWIAKHSDGMIAGPLWRRSPGTISEIACHQALRLPVWELDDFVQWGLGAYPLLPLRWEA